jgi:hypothetical protein
MLVLEKVVLDDEVFVLATDLVPELDVVLVLDDVVVLVVVGVFLIVFV